METKSFSKAAALHQITQSAVSQQVRSLESRFGASLLDRGRKQLSLTPEGSAFYEACGTILKIWGDFENQLRVLKNEVAGTLRIVSIFSIGMHELPPRLKAFQQKHPDVEVTVDYRRSPQVYEMVLKGEADIGLVAYPTKRPDLNFDVFDEDQLVLICPPKHALAAKKRVVLQDLGGQRFVSFAPDTPTRKVVDRHLREAGVEVIPATEFDNIETVKRAVEIESGISIVPANTVKSEVASGLLVALEIDAPNMVRPLGYILSRNHPRPSGLKEFIAALKGAVE